MKKTPKLATRHPETKQIVTGKTLPYMGAYTYYVIMLGAGGGGQGSHDDNNYALKGGCGISKMIMYYMHISVQLIL